MVAPSPSPRDWSNAKAWRSSVLAVPAVGLGLTVRYSAVGLGLTVRYSAGVGVNSGGTEQGIGFIIKVQPSSPRSLPLPLKLPLLPGSLGSHALVLISLPDALSLP